MSKVLQETDIEEEEEEVDVDPEEEEEDEVEDFRDQDEEDLGREDDDEDDDEEDEEEDDEEEPETEAETEAELELEIHTDSEDEELDQKRAPKKRKTVAAAKTIRWKVTDTPYTYFQKYSAIFPGQPPANRRFQIKSVVEDMLRTRGFTEIKTVTTVGASTTQADTIIVGSLPNPPQQTLALIYYDLKIGKDTAKLIQAFQTTKYPKSQLVIVGMLTHAAVSLLKSTTVNFFHPKELTHNYTLHQLVPTHEKLGSAEKEKFLRDYKLEKNAFRLPKLLSTDPIVRFHNWKRGDLIAVKRNIGGVIEPTCLVRIVL